MAKGYTVDFYLITSYMVEGLYDEYIRDALPANVGFDFWEDAVPLDYVRGDDEHIVPKTTSLARQHRLVVYDKLTDYDFFVCFEDDMPIYGDQIEQYLKLSSKIRQWTLEAPSMSLEEARNGVNNERSYMNKLKKEQLMHVRPGFIRTELQLDPVRYPAQEKPFDIELDYDFSDLDGYGSSNNTHGSNQNAASSTVSTDNRIDASICCNSSRIPGLDRPPTSNDLMIWETNAEAISYRQMPDGKWYGLLPGPNRLFPPGRAIDSLRSPELLTGLPLKVRDPGNSILIAQSAGWMMTRRQVLDLDENICNAPFLPPFDIFKSKKENHWYHKLGVEFWSGGMQLYTKHAGCNIQRIFHLDPENLPYRLLYHASNNKQLLIANERLVKVDVLLGQMNALRKRAAAIIERMVKQKY